MTNAELDPYVGTRRASEICGVSISLMARWRADGCGPPWIRAAVGHRAVLYRLSNLRAWKESHG